MYEKCVYKKNFNTFVSVIHMGCSIRKESGSCRTLTQTHVTRHLKHTVYSDWQHTLYMSVWRHTSLPKRRTYLSFHSTFVCAFIVQLFVYVYEISPYILICVFVFEFRKPTTYISFVKCLLHCTVVQELPISFDEAQAYTLYVYAYQCVFNFETANW